MSHMNGKGPDEQGSGGGRKLGCCTGEGDKDLTLMGKGMGLRRKSGGGQGLGKRKKYDEKT